MITVKTRNVSLEVRPVIQSELDAVLEVYRQCEDFLALGPVAITSMDMVLQDMQISRNEGGVFCGLYSPDGKMIDSLDYLPNSY